jgi:hypothetical protein
VLENGALVALWVWSAARGSVGEVSYGKRKVELDHRNSAKRKKDREGRRHPVGATAFTIRIER